MNFASWQGIKEALENKNILTVYDLVADHDAVVDLALQKGALVCRVEDSGRKFYMSDKTEYKIVCERPANLAEMAIVADKPASAHGWKVTPPDFRAGAQQLKVLNLKPSNLKEAGEAFEVMPDSAQGVLYATGYQAYQAVHKIGGISLLLGAAALAGVGGYLLGLRKGKNAGPGGGSAKTVRPSHPDAKAAIRRDLNEDEGIPKPKEEKKPRVVSEKTEVKSEQPSPKVMNDTTGPKAAKTVAVSDDIAEALKDIDQNKSPAGGSRPSGAPMLSGGVTPENVIIKGDKAEPVAGVDSAVIRSQIVLTYRQFLSQAAREALLSGKELPAGADLVNSAFAERVNEMVDMVTKEYHQMGEAELADLWRTQREDRGYITRRGVPQRLLMSACGKFIEADAAKAHSPFSGGAGAEIRSEAEKRAGETDFFERGMKEILKDPVRLGR
jgi:hypothetical protein